MIKSFDFDEEEWKFIICCCFIVFDKGLLPQCRDNRVLLHRLISIYLDICKDELGVDDDEIH